MIMMHKWKITGTFDNSPKMWKEVAAYEEMLWWWRKIRGLTWQGEPKDP